MLRISLPSVCLLSCLVLLVTNWSPSEIAAQSNESGLTELVANETYLVMTVNMESILDLAGKIEALSEYAKRDEKSSADFTNIKRYQLLLSHAGELDEDDEEEDSLFAVSYAWLSEYNDDLDQEEYLQSFKDEFFFTEIELEKEEFYEREIHSIKSIDDSVMFSGGMPVVMFSAENVVINGTRKMLELMVTGDAEGSKGRDLVESLDLESQFHLIMTGGDKLAEDEGIAETLGMMVGPSDIDFAEMLGACKHLEMKLSLEGMANPAQVNIEMDSEEKAEELEQLIKTGLSMVPALMDQAEEEIESMPDEMKAAGFEETFAQMLALGRAASAKAEVSRNGSKIEVVLTECEGLDNFPAMIANAFLMQEIQQETMKERYRDR